MKGTPVLVFSAIAADAPILAMRGGGVPEVIPEDVANLVPPGGTDARHRHPECARKFGLADKHRGFGKRARPS